MDKINSIGSLVAAISVMSEQDRNTTIRQLGQLPGGAQQARIPGKSHVWTRRGFGRRR